MRQGDTLSPLLFNIFINGIVEPVKESGRDIKVAMDNMPVLLFADDMVLVANNEDEQQHLVEKLRSIVISGYWKLMLIRLRWWWYLKMANRQLRLSLDSLN